MENWNTSNGNRGNKIIEIGIGILSALVVILIVRFLPSNLFQEFEENTLDWRYQKKAQKHWADRQGQTIDDIIIVEIDERSIGKLGRFQQWPRSYYAQLIENITAGKPAVIGMDILFLENDAKNPASDDSLLKVIKKPDNIVLSMSFSSANPNNFEYPMDEPPAGFQAEKFSCLIDSNHINIFPSVDRFDGKFIELYNESAGLGFANFIPNQNSQETVIRDFPLFINFAGRQYPAFSTAIIQKVTGLKCGNFEIDNRGKFLFKIPVSDSQFTKIQVPVDATGRLLIDYQGPHRTFRYVSFSDVLQKRVPPETFKGKIVLVGATASGLYDWRPIPYQASFPGVEIHANMIYTILNQSFIRKIDPVLAIIIIFLMAIIVTFIAIRLRLLHSVLLVTGLLFTYGALSLILFVQINLWIEIVAPILTIFFAYTTIISYRYLVVEKDKRVIKTMFAHYLSPDVVNELLGNKEQLGLGGKRTIGTIFFSDVKNFTSVAEKLEPEELVAILNEYLSAMTKIILKYNGYLDKYVGDEIMAIFGIPLPLEYHARNACFAALDMQESLSQLRIKWELEKRPQLEARIGMHIGPFIVGNIGGEERFNYTVIGDSVNLASRLEGANKLYGTEIIISEDVFEIVKDDIIVRELDFVQVKGKQQPVRIYEVLAKKSQDLDEIQLKILDHFAKGLSIYRRGDWQLAYNEFQMALRYNPNDGPSRAFFDRCKHFMDELRYVPPDWDGVYEVISK